MPDNLPLLLCPAETAGSRSLGPEGGLLYVPEKMPPSSAANGRNNAKQHQPPEYTALNLTPSAVHANDRTPLLVGGGGGGGGGAGAGDAPAPPPPSYADDVGCWSGWTREPHMKCFVLTVGMFTVLGLYLNDASEWLTEVAVTDKGKHVPQNFYGVFFTLLCLYFLECIFSDTRKYLGTVAEASEITMYCDLPPSSSSDHIA